MCYRLGRDRGGGDEAASWLMSWCRHITLSLSGDMCYACSECMRGGGGISAIITFPVFISGAISLSQPPYHYAIVLFSFILLFIILSFTDSGGGGAVITSSVSVSLFHFSVYSGILFCFASFYRSLMRGGGAYLGCHHILCLCIIIP